MLCYGHMLSVNLMVKKFFERLMKKKLQKSNQKGFRFEKEKKEKVIYVNWKCYDNSFNSWILKKTWYDWVNISKTEVFRSTCESWIISP